MTHATLAGRIGRAAALLLVLVLPAAAGDRAPARPRPESGKEASVRAGAIRTSAEAAPQERKKRDLTHFNLGKDGLALAGYDPVAYFPEGGGKPKKGLATITAVHDGVTYRFASEDHKKSFLADPARYEPQYGGWCAYAMAAGKKVEIEPESFLVTDGKLYVFYKSFLNDTRAKWRKQPDELRPKADKAWKELVERKPQPERRGPENGRTAR